MNSLFQRFLFISIGLLFSIQASATHLIGADITYTCLNSDSNSYLITLSVYRDCAPGNTGFDESSNLRVFPIGSSVFFNFDGDLTDVIEVELIPEDTCAVIPPDLCIEKGIYEFELNLPDSTQGFEVNYQRCCMGANTNNILDPQVVGMNVSALIPPKAFSPCYDSPVFNEEPLLAICLNDVTVADFGANVTSGSPGTLNYQFYTPFKGSSPGNPTSFINKPYNEIDWLSGYSELSPINSNIPIELDNISGEFTAQVNEIGYFLMAEEVLVRDSLNQIVARVDRVFRYTVADCSAGDHKVPIISELNNNVQICSDDDYTFELGNSGTTDSLFWILDGDTLGDEEDLVHSFSSPGTYVLELHGVAHPDECFESGVDFLDVEVFDIEPLFTGRTYLCAGEENQFTDTTFLPSSFSYGIAEWSWNFGDGETSNQQNPIHKYSIPGVYEVRLTITLTNGCKKTIVKNNYVTVYEGELSISSLNETCINSPVDFFANLELPAGVNNPIVSYLWDFGDGDTSSAVNPTHIYDALGTFDVSLTVEVQTGCQYSISNIDQILIFDNYIDIDFNLTYDTIEFPFKKPVEAITTTNNFDVINWSLNNVSMGTGKNFYYELPQEFDEDFIKVQADVVEGSCTYQIIKHIKILYKDNLFIPNAFTPNGDGVNEGFKPMGRTVDHAVFYEFKIFNRYGEEYFSSNDKDEYWFGFHKDKKAIESGLYVYTLEIRTEQSGSYLKQGTVMLIK